MRRDAAGRVFVAGLDIGAGGAQDDGTLRDWFFRQHEFVIRDGSAALDRRAARRAARWR